MADYAEEQAKELGAHAVVGAALGGLTGHSTATAAAVATTAAVATALAPFAIVGGLIWGAVSLLED